MNTKKNIKKRYQLEGINCPDCLQKIEREISNLDGIENCTVNIITKILSLTIRDPNNLEALKRKIYHKIRISDHNIIIKDLNKALETIESIKLEGINCPDCLQKIEKKISELSEIESCSVNIITKVLTFTTYREKNLDLLKDAVYKKIKSLDRDVKIKKDTTSKTTVSSNEKHKNGILLIISGAILFTIGLLLHNYLIIKLSIFIVSYILIGFDIILKALRNIIHGRIFDENFLMAIATIGAFCVGEFSEAVAVILLYKIGMHLEERAVNKSRNAIKVLMDIKPEFANLIKNESIKRVSPENVKVGEIIIVKPGEKVPLDGTVILGSSFVDTKAITGESIPRKINKEDKIYSGFINGNKALTVKVGKEFSESTISRILELVQNASANKSKTETFFTKFARIYTPIVVITALCLAVLPPLLFAEYTFHEWIYRALIFLVVSCPCALVISIPLTFFGGIGAASKKGILIKGGNYIDALNNTETVIFDKTGTLTKGVFNVVKVSAETGFSEDQVLKHSASAETYSNHPIATSIKKAYRKKNEQEKIRNYEEISGHGISCIIDNSSILCGNKKLMEKFNITYKPNRENGTILYIAVNRIFAGSIIISDELKTDSKQAIKQLKEIGIKNTIILSGDNSVSTEKIANELSINEFHANLLPEDKLNELEKIVKRLHKNIAKDICSPYRLIHLFQKFKDPENHSDCFKEKKVVFVGDGINDAPVITQADIGIAMGSLGSDAAIESADIVLMNDKPSMLPKAIKIAKKTKKIVYQNITLALGIKTAVLLLAVIGMATMWEAVFADVGVTILAVLNSLRTLKN
jgi:Zn2+/Cd2+-exporting ATPase